MFRTLNYRIWNFISRNSSLKLQIEDERYSHTVWQRKIEQEFCDALRGSFFFWYFNYSLMIRIISI